MNGYRGLPVVFVFVFALPAYAMAQSVAGAGPLTTVTARDDLMRTFEAESKRGTSISYTQTYRAHGREVKFRGSIFGAIQDVQVDGCELKITSEIVDLYSGTIDGKSVAQTQAKYVTTIQFKLTPRIADELKVMTARPVRQLPKGTNATCSGVQQCTLNWVTLKTDAPLIRSTEITNDVADYDGDVKDFDGPVDQFWLPVSSADAGSELIAKMQAFARSCAN
jgi:hypothetical protein